MLELRATLADMDEQTRQRLAAAADAYEQAPRDLKAEIIAAGRKGDKPSEIVRAIRHVYTYDYVARLVREDKAARDTA